MNSSATSPPGSRARFAPIRSPSPSPRRPPASSQAAARRRGPKVDRGRLGRARLRLEHGIPVTPAAAARASRARRWGPASSSTFGHMHRVLDVDLERRRVRMEPGAIHTRVQREAAPTACGSGPTPSSGDSARSAGTSEPRRGRPHAASRRDQGPPAGAHGRVARRHRRDAGGGGRPNPPAAWTRTAGQLTEILPRRGAAVPSERPRANKNSCGYDLWGAWSPGDQVSSIEPRFDPLRLLCGSEGRSAWSPRPRCAPCPSPRRRRSRSFTSRRGTRRWTRCSRPAGRGLGDRGDGPHRARLRAERPSRSARPDSREIRGGAVGGVRGRGRRRPGRGRGARGVGRRAPGEGARLRAARDAAERAAPGACAGRRCRWSTAPSRSSGR